MSGASSDKRYGSAKWKRRRREVMQRDRFQCQVTAGCTRPADCVDHIDPVTPLTSDAMFFDPLNLRAACTPCNLTRAMSNRRFFGGRYHPRRVPPSIFGPRRRVVIVDYTRSKP